MGIFYYVHSVALAEDLPGLNETYTDINAFYNDVDRGYTQVNFKVLNKISNHMIPI